MNRKQLVGFATGAILATLDDIKVRLKKRFKILDDALFDQIYRRAVKEAAGRIADEALR